MIVLSEREMQQIKVYVSDESYICISQDHFGGDDSVIVIHPEQIDLLIKWLKEAKDEL